MSTIARIDKPVIIKFENRNINLPAEIQEKIDKFWNNAIKENPNLYNGQDYTVENVINSKDKIEMIVINTNYAHYLYDERIGVRLEKYRCCAPWGGIILLTKDDYLVVGEMGKETSVPFGLQIPGGGVDKNDIKDGIIDINLTIKRELKEEVNINLDEIKYKLEFMEYASKTRNAYGFIGIGILNINKEELEQNFKDYKEYLINNNLEIEFNRLIFLKKETALKELDDLPNYKRPYLRDLIKEVSKM